eukprot:gnl/MRDRNA2_/MRDRNA2_33280_c0_seq1.p1 gnl/MRDRNA2_/MRDRNA2_33280_c0~~gnl/MRDRNA2_/MRDRNA2_33280_c0_seq1.p1  ORF type:complete len:562 (+),score=79.56 gnl/MRDRNA2_/MRDRNA2_33280_c0_seq1:88-1773(+)
MDTEDYDNPVVCEPQEEDFENPVVLDDGIMNEETRGVDLEKMATGLSEATGRSMDECLVALREHSDPDTALTWLLGGENPLSNPNDGSGGCDRSNSDSLGKSGSKNESSNSCNGVQMSSGAEAVEGFLRISNSPGAPSLHEVMAVMETTGRPELECRVAIESHPDIGSAVDSLVNRDASSLALGRTNSENSETRTPTQPISFRMRQLRKVMEISGRTEQACREALRSNPNVDSAVGFLQNVGQVMEITGKPEAKCETAVKSYPDIESAIEVLLAGNDSSNHGGNWCYDTLCDGRSFEQQEDRGSCQHLVLSYEDAPNRFHSSPLTRLPLQVRISLICYFSVRVGTNLGIIHPAFLGLRLASATSLTLTNILPAGCHKLLPAVFRSILHRCNCLQACDLTPYYSIQDHDLKALIQRCGSTFRDLSIAGCQSITNDGMMAVAACRDLRSLNLSGCRDISDEGLEEIASKCANLHTLYLSDCRRVTHRALTALAEGCPNLNVLCLRGCPEADPRKIPSNFVRTSAYCSLLKRTQKQYYSEDGRRQELTRPPMTPIFNTDVRSGM